MAAAAELPADFADVHLRIFGAQADAREFGFDLFKHAGDYDGFDGAQMVDQTFRVIAFRTGAGEIFFLQPEPDDTVVVRHAEFTINVLE